MDGRPRRRAGPVVGRSSTIVGASAVLTLAGIMGILFRSGARRVRIIACASSRNRSARSFAVAADRMACRAASVGGRRARRRLVNRTKDGDRHLAVASKSAPLRLRSTGNGSRRRTATQSKGVAHPCLGSTATCFVWTELVISSLGQPSLNILFCRRTDHYSRCWFSAVEAIAKPTSWSMPFGPGEFNRRAPWRNPIISII